MSDTQKWLGRSLIISQPFQRINHGTQEHLIEAVNLFSMTTVLAFLYTLIFILYCLAFRLSYAQFRDHHGKIKRQTACTLALSTALLICATLDVTICNRIAEVSYIDNRTLPGGPLGLQATLSVATLLNLDNTVDSVEGILILGVLLWCIQVVWSGTRCAVPLTIISLFFYLVTAGLVISLTAIKWNSDSTSLDATPAVEGIIYMMVSLFSVASLVFMTSAIIVRLIFIRRKHIKLMGKSDVAGQYLGIAAMLIESYALETLWDIGLLISSGLQYAPTLNLFAISVTQVDILSNFLVLYRVLSGPAWTRQTQDRLSTLRWASDGVHTTTSRTVDSRRASVPGENSPVIGFRDSV